MLREKREVIKHSAAIQIQNNITLLQRRAWNVMLANAYDELPEEEEHRIRVMDLMQVLEFDSKNEAYLKEALEALVGCKVKWNVLDKDDAWEWGVTTLLAQAKIKRGTCIYAYSPELRRRLHNPRMYARISLSMQNKFGSKHAQALWELCVDYLDEARGCGETPYISLEQFRQLTGLEHSSYASEFKILNRDVIKPAIKEINKNTDCWIEVEKKRQQRKVTAIKFKVRRVVEIPGKVHRQGTLFPDLEDMPLIVKEMKDAGLSADDTWKIWQQEFGYVRADKRPEGVDFATYIREKLDLLKRRKAEGKVKSSTGFLLKAIRENYSNAEYTEEQRKESARKKAEENARTQRQLAREKAQLEAAREAARHAAAARLMEERPDLLTQTTQALLGQDAGFRHLYDQTKPPAENYQSHRFLTSYTDAYLEQHYPEHFTGLGETYDVRLAEIEARLTGQDQAAA